jgi:hypothetical protein
MQQPKIGDRGSTVSLYHQIFALCAASISGMSIISQGQLLTRCCVRRRARTRESIPG